jgi:hypothetical protein
MAYSSENSWEIKSGAPNIIATVSKESTRQLRVERTAVGGDDVSLVWTERIRIAAQAASQWDQYIEGWQKLLGSVDEILWSLLQATAFLVRALAFCMLLYGLAEKTWFWGEREATKRIITSAFVLIFVTVPFFLAGLPILYPEW